MPTEVLVLGLPELRAALTAKSAELHAVAAVVVDAEAHAVADDVRARAPYREDDPEDEHIRENVSVEAEGALATVRSSSRHAGFMEFGTTADEPQPSMGPAAEAARASFVERATSAFKEVL